MDEDLLTLATRRRLYDAVRRRPGIGGREAQRLAGTAWGETVYHLDRLVDAGLVHRERTGHQDHYFVASVPVLDRRLLRIVRSPSARHLLVALHQSAGPTIPELSAVTGLSAGRLGVHLTRLIQQGVVRTGRRGRLRTFELVERARVVQLLLTYRESVADRWVEALFETWTELFRT